MRPYSHEKVLLYTQIGSTQLFKGKLLQPPTSQISQCLLIRYWTNEFQLFYNPTTGLDIDGAWIDMNEPANVRTVPLFFHRIHTRLTTTTVLQPPMR